MAEDERIDMNSPEWDDGYKTAQSEYMLGHGHLQETLRRASKDLKHVERRIAKLYKFLECPENDGVLSTLRDCIDDLEEMRREVE
jgi:hypothetical protein